ncbi:MAG: response regulator [Alphaproteobacteria bacterium]|nr:response regulator [Alphaproteobacteria bacterium]
MKRSLNILVLEDDRDNADSLAEVFAMDDHRVTVAYSGEQAIEAFRRCRFDVGFFDVMMPGKNGVESFVEIKGFRPEAKIFFMTGFSGDDLMQRARDHGAMGVFGKPVDLNRVLDAMERAVA